MSKAPVTAAGGGPGRARVLGLLAAVLVGALALRAVGIHRGSPELQVDEPIMVEGAGALLEGVRPDVVLGWPGGPQLIALSAVFAGDLIATRGNELIAPPEGVSRPEVLDRHYADFYRDPGRWYVLDRAVTILFALGTVLLTFLLARRLAGGASAAIFAAALVAANRLHVEYSHLVLPDVPMTFFFTLSVLISLRYLDRPSAGGLGGAAFTAGLAAATKFNAAPLLLFVVLLAAVARPGEGGRRWRRVLLGAAFGLGGLVVGCPWLVTDLPLVAKDFLWRNVYQQGIEGRPGAGGGSGWWQILRALSGFGVGVAPSLLVLILLTAWRRRGTAVLACLIVGYAGLLGFSSSVSPKWLLPLVPACAVLAGALYAWCAEKVRGRGRAVAWALPGIALALVIVDGAVAARSDLRLLEPSPREELVAWVDENVPAGTTVAVAFFAENPFRESRDALLERISALNADLANPGKSRPGVPVSLLPTLLNEERFELQRARHLLESATGEGYRVRQVGAGDRYGELLGIAREGSAKVFVLRLETNLRADRGPREAEIVESRRALLAWLEEHAARSEEVGRRYRVYVLP